MQLHPSSLFLLSFGILSAKQTIRSFVLFNGGESTHGRIKAVIASIVIALADFAQQNRTGTWLHFKVVVQILLNEDGFTRSQTDLGSCGNRISTTIRMDGNVGFIVDRFIGIGVIDPDQYIAAASVDDILGLEPMEMVRRILAFFQVQQLFRINLGILVGHLLMTVADRNERESHLVKVTHTVVGDIPA